MRFAACHLMLPPGGQRGWEAVSATGGPGAEAGAAPARVLRVPGGRGACQPMGHRRPAFPQAFSRASYLMFIVLLLRGMFKGFL